MKAISAHTRRARCAALFVVVLIAKAPTSLLVAVVIPILVLMMLFIHRQYRSSASKLAVREDGVLPAPRREERVIVPVPGINRAVVHAVNVGRSIAPDVRAVLVSDEPEESAAIRQRWERQMPDVPLVVVESPYRALVGPLIAYLDVLDAAWPPEKEAPITFVVIPEYVARSWWERLLYNQSAKRLRTALIGRPQTVVVAVPYRRDDGEEVVERLGIDVSQDPPLEAVVEAQRERSKTLKEMALASRFFFEAPEAYDDKAARKHLGPESRPLLELALATLEALVNWTAPAIHEAIQALAEKTGSGLGKIAQPLRVAVSGGSVSPPIDLTLAILGREATLTRVTRAIGYTGRGSD